MPFTPPSCRVWHPEDIKAEVRKRGGNLTRVAREAGLAGVSGRVAFLMPVPAANRAIARFIGVPVNELWPQWFDDQGNRRTSVSSGEDSGKKRRGHGQKREMP
jgi:Ner family transcriptional regulator